MNQLLILCLVVASASAKHIDFKPCGGAKLNYVDVEPCESEPCDFRPGNTYTVTGDFISEKNAERPYMKVQVKALGFWLDYPGIDNDPCLHYTECPIKKGELVKFKIGVESVGLVHNINTEVRIALYEDKDDQTDEAKIVCAIATVHAV